MNKRTFLGSLAALCATGLGLAKEKIPLNGPKFEWHETYFFTLNGQKYKEGMVHYVHLLEEKKNTSIEELKKKAEKIYTRYYGNMNCACIFHDGPTLNSVTIYPLPPGEILTGYIYAPGQYVAVTHKVFKG